LQVRDYLLTIIRILSCATTNSLRFLSLLFFQAFMPFCLISSAKVHIFYQSAKFFTTFFSETLKILFFQLATGKTRAASLFPRVPPEKLVLIVYSASVSRVNLP